MKTKKEWHEEAKSMYHYYRGRAKKYMDDNGGIGELCLVNSCKAIALSELLDKFGYRYNQDIEQEQEEGLKWEQKENL